jgi:hypothetical protein
MKNNDFIKDLAAASDWQRFTDSHGEVWKNIGYILSFWSNKEYYRELMRNNGMEAFYSEEPEGLAFTDLLPVLSYTNGEIYVHLYRKGDVRYFDINNLTLELGPQ